MSSDVTVARVDGVTFFGTEPSVGFAIVRFEGWNDGPAARGENVERPAAHGNFDMPVTRGPRLVTMSGWCRADSMMKLGHYKNRLMGILSDGRKGRLVVDEFGESTWADVRLFGEPTFARRGKSRYADWSIKLRAVNPRRYGEVRDFSGGSPAVHFGNFPATPRLIVGAGSGGYTVTGPSGRVVTVGAAPAAAHEIDFATGGLFLSGVRQVGAITVYQPWGIPPGLPGVTATVTGSRSLMQRVTDTFI